MVSLAPKPFQLLLYLIENRSRVISSVELRQHLWPDTHVTRSSLGTAFYEMRRAIRDGEPLRWIFMARGRGYRFVGAAEERLPGPSPACEERSAGTQLLADRPFERAEVEGALGAARGGARRIVLLHGPPGIGKTHTLLELTRRAEASGFEVLLGRAHKGAGAPPFWPWIQVLRSALETRGAQSAAAGQAREARLLLERLETRAGTSVESASEAHFWLFDGVASFLLRAARTRPLAVLLEDLHWADESSLALLLFVARSAQRAALLIVGTHRDLAASADVQQRTLARVLAEPGSSTVALVGLPLAVVQRILSDAIGAEAGSDVAEQVYAVSGGNPFFVCELARLLARARRDGLTLGAALPLRLPDAVRARIAECSLACRRLLRTACAIGFRVEVALLWRVLEARGEALLDAFDEAEQHGLLTRDGDSPDYRFTHAIVRETLHADLGTAERVSLHRDIALALEAHSEEESGRLAELAYHFAEAAPLGGPERAIHYARRAARHATGVSAPLDAVAHTRRALALLGYLERPDPALRCTLMLELGEALAAAHQPVEAVEEAFYQTIELARALELPEPLARAAVGSTAYAHGKDTLALLHPRRARTRLERLAPTLEHAARALTAPRDAALRARALLALAALHDAACDAPRAASLIAEALACTPAESEPALHAEALLQQWYSGATLDRSEERAKLAQSALELAQRAQRRDLETTAQTALAFLALERGDRSALDAACTEIGHLASVWRTPEALGAADVLRCLTAQLDGDLDAAERAMTEGRELAWRLNFTQTRATVAHAVQAWWLALLRGRAGSIVRDWERLVDFDPSLRLPRFLLVRLYTELGREPQPHLVRTLLAPGVSALPRDDHWLLCAAIAAGGCDPLLDRERAEALFDALLPYAGRSITLGWILVCAGSVAAVLGSLAARLERWSDCVDLFDLALAHARNLRSPLLELRSQLEYGRALRNHPDAELRAHGRRLLRSAARRAQPLGVQAGTVP